MKSATAHMIPCKPTHSQIRAIILTVEQWRKAIVAERLPFPNPNPYEATLFMQTEVGEAVDALIRRYSRTTYARASGNPKRARTYTTSCLTWPSWPPPSLGGGNQHRGKIPVSPAGTAFKQIPCPKASARRLPSGSCWRAAYSGTSTALSHYHPPDLFRRSGVRRSGRAARGLPGIGPHV